MKNDLSKLLKQKGPILKDEPDVKAPVVARPQSKREVQRKPRKTDNEKVSVRLQTLLTKSEAKKLSERAGDVSLSRYIRQALKRAGEI